MGLLRNTLLCVPAVLLGLIGATTSTAAIVNQVYSGSFPGMVSGILPDEGSALELSLTLPSAGDFTAYTTSYATGGFQPNLTLFNSAGITVATQGATPPSGAMTDSMTGMALDGLLTATGLTAGNYTLTLTDWELGQSITATNLSDGFTSNFGDGMTFVDVSGATRTNAYTVDMTFTPSASAAPEPATWLFVFVPVAAGMAFRRFRQA